MALRAISAPVPAQALVPTLALLAPQLASSPQGSQVAVVDGVPYQFVMVLMRAPVVIGWVLMGFPLGQPLADEMRQLLSVHVALVVQGAQGPAAVHVSTLPAPLHGPVLAMGADGGELASADGLLLARLSPLPSLNGQVHAVLLRSVDAVVAPYRQLQVLLSIISVGGLLLFALGSGVMAQRVISPHQRAQRADHTLRSLMRATQRLSRGEYDTPMEHTGRRDEIGQLSRSFDRMRLDIASGCSYVNSVPINGKASLSSITPASARVLPTYASLEVADVDIWLVSAMALSALMTG
eukprot:gene37128-45806_t